MKSGVPWQCAEVGRSGGREPSNPSREDNCRHRADVPNPAAVDTLRGDLAEIRLLLDDAAPRSDIEALQGEINELAERADESRGTDNAAAAVASIERRLTEIRDALCVLRPAESLLGMARVVQQASRKIEIIAGAWDPAVLEQLGSAVAAMRGIAAQAASPEALAKLSNEVCALGAKLDDAQRRADGRILSMLEGRVAMLVDQIQAHAGSIIASPGEAIMAGIRLTAKQAGRGRLALQPPIGSRRSSSRALRPAPPSAPSRGGRGRG